MKLCGRFSQNVKFKDAATNISATVSPFFFKFSGLFHVSTYLKLQNKLKIPTKFIALVKKINHIH